MATTDAVICVGDGYGYPYRETRCEGRQIKSRQAADDRDKGQQRHSQSAGLNSRGLQTEITPISPSAVADQEAPSRAGNEHSGTTISLNSVAAFTFVYGFPQNIFWQIVEDLRGKGKPINYETLIDKCNSCDGFYAPKGTAHSEEFTFEGPSDVFSNPSLTIAFESLPSSVHTPEISPSHYYQQMNSTTPKPPSICSDNNNADNDQSPGHNSEHQLLSLPTIPHDYYFKESKQNDLYNVTEDLEDALDGRNLESNDGLDRWLVSDFSNPLVHISESNSAYIGTPVFSQNLSGLEPNVPTNKPGQSVLLPELLNEKPSAASLNPFGHVPLGQQNSVSTLPELTSARSCADGLSSRLNADDSTSSRLNADDSTSSRLNADDSISSVLYAGDSISSGLNASDSISSELNASDSISRGLNSADDISSGLKADGGLTVSADLPDIVCDGTETSRHADELQNTQATESKPAKKPRTLTEAEMFQFTFSLLEMEHQLLEKSRLCHGCHQKPREVTFLPCGHFITCADCAEPMYVCPLCDKSILATVNTFLS
ncbi:unnamed protein product [Candidula unifasciata]|uniref:RING-type domain-containing protein n=1 Tax=Candidula unifasciata TaxID=100452 RepID=A0A8S3ZLI4_9EUPU|nr:unnamed protein product [Candidula unifasciata]